MGMWNWIKLIIWVCIPFFLLLLPATYFDTGQALCPSKLLLDKECPGCGITRSVQHAIHFDFKEAWDFNKLIIIVLPLLIYFWVKTLLNLYRTIKQK